MATKKKAAPKKRPSRSKKAAPKEPSLVQKLQEQGFREVDTNGVEVKAKAGAYGQGFHGTSAAKPEQTFVRDTGHRVVMKFEPGQQGAADRKGLAFYKPGTELPIFQSVDGSEPEEATLNGFFANDTVQR